MGGLPVIITRGGSEASGIGQKETLSSDAVSETASANLTESSQAGLALRRCPRMKSGTL